MPGDGRSGKRLSDRESGGRHAPQARLAHPCAGTPSDGRAGTRKTCAAQIVNAGRALDYESDSGLFSSRHHNS